MSRAAEVRNHLISKGRPQTVREICAALSYPNSDSKFVSAILVGWIKAGEVVGQPSICSVSNRKATSYIYNFGWRTGQGSPKTPPPPPKAPKAPRTGTRTRARPQPNTLPPNAPPPDAQKAMSAAGLQRRLELRRKVAQQAREEHETFILGQKKKDALERANLAFTRLTGCQSKNLDEMKLLYRKAAFKLHPDQGGNASDFADLSSAWQTIRQNASAN